MTHMHIDHTSAISEFPNSTFVVSEVEWERGDRRAEPLLNGYRRAHYDYAFDYRTVDFDRGGIDSYATFGRSFDLFGDGSIRLAYTPGHSAGHMSVIAHLDERDFVIGGDATYTQAQLDGDAPLAPRPFDAHNYRRSLQELKLFRREFPDAIVTPGHDPSSTPGSTPATSRRASSSYISRTGAKICSATSSWRSRLGASSSGKESGSPNWTVTLGKRKRFQRRTSAEPWIATGTTGRARFERDAADPRLRPRPARRCASARPRRRRAASRPGSRIVKAVLNASSSWWPRRTGKTPPCL